MKKKIFAVLVLSMLLVLALIGCDNTLSKIQLAGGSDSELTTLMLSDIRFDGSGADDVRERMITQMIEDKKPEFIAINGNIVNCQNNGAMMKKAVAFIDSFDIPWATSIGELDVKGNTSKKEIVKILTDKKLKNSLVLRGDSYNYNYVLEMLNYSGKVKNLLYFFDTSERCTDEVVEWYRNTAKNLSFKYADKQGELLHSHLFVNKPLPGFDKHPTNYDKYTITPWENSGILEKAVIELKSTKSVLAGFDNLANGAEFDRQNNLRYAYIRTMLFDSSMDGDIYKEQKGKIGCSTYSFRDTSYVDINAYEYNPDKFVDAE